MPFPRGGCVKNPVWSSLYMTLCALNEGNPAGMPINGPDMQERQFRREAIPRLFVLADSVNLYVSRGVEPFPNIRFNPKIVRDAFIAFTMGSPWPKAASKTQMKLIQSHAAIQPSCNDVALRVRTEVAAFMRARALLDERLRDYFSCLHLLRYTRTAELAALGTDEQTQHLHIRQSWANEALAVESILIIDRIFYGYATYALQDTRSKRDPTLLRFVLREDLERLTSLTGTLPGLAYMVDADTVAWLGRIRDNNEDPLLPTPLRP